MPRRKQPNKSLFGNISELKDRPRSKPFRAQYWHNNKPHREYFATYEEAKLWLDEQSVYLRKEGKPMNNVELKDETIGDLLTQFLQAQSKEYQEDRQGLRIKNTLLKNNSLCEKSLCGLSAFDARMFVAQRREAGRKDNTIKLEYFILKKIFSYAKQGLITKDRRYEDITNPFELKINDWDIKDRTRELLPEEEVAVRAQLPKLHSTNRYYMGLALDIALETGMREEEIISLKWKHINATDSRIKVAKEKNDRLKKTAHKGRTIVLPPMLQMQLGALLVHLLEGKPLDRITSCHDKSTRLCKPPMPQRDPIPIEELREQTVLLQIDGSPMTVDSIQTEWRKLRKMAELQPDLETGQRVHFHDLRRTANVRMEEYLTTREAKLILSHADPENKGAHGTYQNKIKIRNKVLQVIQEKMERQLFKGKTVKEREEERIKEYSDFIQSHIEAGLTEKQSKQLYHKFAEKRLDDELKKAVELGIYDHQQVFEMKYQRLLTPFKQTPQ